MHNQYEIIDYSGEFPVKLFCHHLGHVPPHWHDSLELLLVLSGKLSLTIGTAQWTLNEDDIVLINANHVHATTGENCILMALQIRPTMFGDDAITQMTFSLNSQAAKDKREYDGIKAILARLVHVNTSAGAPNRVLSYALVYWLMHELIVKFQGGQALQPPMPKQRARLKSVLDYVNQHSGEDITLSAIARREFMSASHLSHLFEKHLGISFSNYLTRIRIENSMTALLHTDDSIQAIAEASGFPSARSYATQFKKHMGVLPSDYRRDKSTGMPAVDPLRPISYLHLEKYDYLGRLSAYLRSEGAAQPEAHKLRFPLGRINVGAKGEPFGAAYKKFCSVGRLSDVLLAPVQRMLAVQQREIGFEFVKFHGLFDDSLMVYREDDRGMPVHNFALVDQALDYLLSVGLKPLIQLGFMPHQLAKDPDRTLFQVPFCLSEPKDEGRWAELVAAFTRHVVRRYGAGRVKAWLFTFWNETLTHFPFDFPHRQTALRLYEISYRAVKSVAQDIPFAAMSVMATSVPEPAYDVFLAYADDHGCPPDAYIFHFYPVNGHGLKLFSQGGILSPGEAGGMVGLSTDPDAFTAYLDGLGRWLPKRDRRPLYIGEWSMSPSHREWLHDTCFEGVYTVRNILMNHRRADSFCHWTLTDWMTEWDFPDELFHGGMGMFTYNGVKKPVYYAYMLLSKLGPTLIAAGEGYCITRREGDISILLYNYRHFTNLYADGLNFAVTAEARYNAFDNPPALAFSFILSGLAGDTCHITETIVNRQHGSAFDKWLEMGGEPLTNDETELLKALSQPLVVKRRERIVNGAMRMEPTLAPHEMRHIQVCCQP